jgi:hypothetical protein
MRVRTAQCPLCSAPVEGDDVLRTHLDESHDLRDDPGAQTSLADLIDILPSELAVDLVDAEPPPAPRAADLRP